MIVRDDFGVFAWKQVADFRVSVTEMKECGTGLEVVVVCLKFCILLVRKNYAANKARYWKFCEKIVVEDLSFPTSRCLILRREPGIAGGINRYFIFA